MPTLRSPPKGLSLNHEANMPVSSCELCDKVDTEEMVQCDQCDKWYHFVCAVVGESINEKQFICVKCVTNLQGMDGVKHCSNAPSVDERPTTSVSHPCCMPSQTVTTGPQQIQRLPDRMNVAMSSAMRDERFPVPGFTLPSNITQGQRTVNADPIASRPMCYNTLSYARPIPPVPTLNFNIPVTSSNAVNMSGVFGQHSAPQQIRQPVTYEQILSPAHLAARNAISKDLPTFTGKPEEWPMFISSYENSTRICGFSNEENLNRLQRSLKGAALEAVKYRLMLPNTVPMVIETLCTLFGRPELIIYTLIQTVREQPPIRADKFATLINFSLNVQNLCATLEASGLNMYLNNPMLLQELTDKLPPQIKLNWALFKRTRNPVTLSTFGDWVFEMAQAANEVTLPSTSSSNQEHKNNKWSKDHAYLHAHAEHNKTLQSNPHSRNTFERNSVKCDICNASHKVCDCYKFQRLSHVDKWNAIKSKGLCRKCLGRHSQFRGKSNTICGKNDCRFKHHPLLHNDKNDVIHDGEPKDGQPFTSTCNTHQQPNQKTLFRIVPVTIHNGNARVDTFAFLDEGSSLTLMERSLAGELQLRGTPENLCLKWTANTIRNEPNSERVTLKVSGIEANARLHKLRDVRTVDNLGLPMQSVSVSAIQKSCPHLQNIPLQSYNNAVPRLLIGIDNWRVGIPLQIREGMENQPVATKTRLGWIVHGFCATQNKQAVQHYSFSHCECKSDNELHQMMKEFFSIENMGVAVSSTNLESNQDKRALEIMKSTTVKVGGRYETGLIWKYDHIILPDSYNMAYRRMVCFEKQMASDPELRTSVQQTIRDHMTKGYARKLKKEERGVKYDHTWYLPIFSVSNPNKPKKRRIVWDAAARVNGISLNSALLSGPDQMVLLSEVPHRFRERKIAITGDIREMFHQVLIRKQDQHSQRLLWRETSDVEPDTYVMQVMTFGATCSPSSAQYVKNLKANRYVEQFPRAVTSIVKNHYVDDLIDSVDTIAEAIQLINDVKFIHASGGFEIRNWTSNSAQVLRAVGADPGRAPKSFGHDAVANQHKVLGMWWCTTSDTFTYSLKYTRLNREVISGCRRPTNCKREVLRTLMSTFDPLGFLSPFLVCVKILLQEIWRTPLDWDDVLTDALYEKWIRWIKILPSIETIQIPRCYSIHPSAKFVSVELHTFVDASESAYAAVSYMRIETVNSIECALVGAKNKVAPQRPMSIPRLELQAAILGTRLSRCIRDSHTLEIKRCIFWTDFENVADEATKWQHAVQYPTSKRWLNGPGFLKEPEGRWPYSNMDNPGTGDTEEIRIHCMHGDKKMDGVIDVNRFSKWTRMLRTMVYVKRFIFNLMAMRTKTQRRMGAIWAHEYQEAEMALIRQCQANSYPAEINLFQHNRNTSNRPRKSCVIEKSSPMYNRSPYMDQDGILRIRGRIDASVDVQLSTKRPILLPRSSKITDLIVDFFHRKYHHHNHETAVNEIRKQYDIPALRTVLRRIIKCCQACKNRRAMPVAPEMADLPPARLATFTRPFTFVGVDYFGPMLVTVGKRVEKRWGVLFTCLTIRAIHIEVASSLSTDSFMVLRNFMARRGTPAELFSDNGTNFRGADTELRNELKKLNHDEMGDKMFPVAKIKWSFNPSAAPHMGGCWERLIQSVKKTLRHIKLERIPGDELLRCTLLEIENIVNSRPLTYIPIETGNDEALTPNHFLLGTSGGSACPGRFTDDGCVLKGNWKIAQRLANRFWRRWILEYLPDLTRRTKWFRQTEPIKNGDVVIIVNENEDRNRWRKGIVIDTSAGRDSRVRKAVIQTATGVLTRPAVKLAVLDVRDSTDDIVGKSIDADQCTGGRNVAKRGHTDSKNPWLAKQINK